MLRVNFVQLFLKLWCYYYIFTIAFNINYSDIMEKRYVQIIYDMFRFIIKIWDFIALSKIINISINNDVWNKLLNKVPNKIQNYLGHIFAKYCLLADIMSLFHEILYLIFIFRYISLWNNERLIIYHLV